MTQPRQQQSPPKRGRRRRVGAITVQIRVSEEQLAAVDRIVAASPYMTSRTAVFYALLTRALATAQAEPESVRAVG